MELKINAIQIEQPGGVFYYSKIKTKDLKDKLYIRRRSKYEDGIQRDVNERRTREIAEYLSLADAVIPTPLVISIKLDQVHEHQENEQLSLQLTTDINGFLGEIIDGQHRYEGLLRTAYFDQYEIPVCIFIELSIEDKANVFSTINSTQVKVPKSYIYDLFEYSEENIPEKFCHDVCRTLNYENEGPLYRRIKMLGKKVSDDEVLSQAAFIDAILPLVSINSKEDKKAVLAKATLVEIDNIPLRNLYISNDVVVFSKIFSNYLRALQKVADLNWNKFVLKSIGIKVFSRLLGVIVLEGLRKGDLSVGFFLGPLNSIAEEIRACTTGTGTNKRAEEENFKKLADALKLKWAS